MSRFRAEMAIAVTQLHDIVTHLQSWWIALYSGLAFAPVSAFAGLWGVPFIGAKWIL